MAKETYNNDSGLQRLKEAIKNKAPGNLYVFHGEETFLLNYYLEKLKAIIVDEVTESFNFHKLTSETFDPVAFADAVENLPMMAERTFIWVDDIDIFDLLEDEKTKLQDVLTDIPDYCCIVFTYVTAKWRPDKRQKKLYDAIVNNGEIVEFEKQSQRDLISWITRHFTAGQKKISQDLCAYLIDITDGTMTTLSSEIAKIIAFSGADAIVQSDIDAVTEPTLDAVVFEMTNFLGQSKYDAALIKLQQLLKMQEDPLVILGTIGSHFRKLSVARTLLNSGKGSMDLSQICHIGEYAAKKIMGSARSFSNSFCQLAVTMVLETDYQIKTSHDSANRLLELLIIRLAREAKDV